MSFSDASNVTKVGLIMSIIALMFYLIGLSTSYWIEIPGQHYGLFQICSGSQCTSYTRYFGNLAPDWLVFARALIVIGFLPGLGCMAIIGLYVFIKTDMAMLQKIGCALAFSAAGFIMFGAAVVAAKADDLGGTNFLSWSFALAIIGGMLYIPTGVLVLNQ